jgi:hypothetical protein
MPKPNIEHVQQIKWGSILNAIVGQCIVEKIFDLKNYFNYD